MARSWLGSVVFGGLMAGAVFTGGGGARAEEAFDATYRDWNVFCGICAMAEEQLCTMQTTSSVKVGDRALTLAFHLNTGTRPTLALDVPAAGPEPVRFAVDAEDPVVLVPPDVAFMGMTAELFVDSENMTDTLIAAFRRGAAVTVTFSGEDFEKLSPTFSLKGFGAGLDAMIAHLPANPRTCAD